MAFGGHERPAPDASQIDTRCWQARSPWQPCTPLDPLGPGRAADNTGPAMSGRARLAHRRRFPGRRAGRRRPQPRTPSDKVEVRRPARGEEGTGEPIGERYNADLARRTVPEWRALLAGLLAVPEIGDAFESLSRERRAGCPAQQPIGTHRVLSISDVLSRVPSS